jgi:hypothetical protein
MFHQIFSPFGQKREFFWAEKEQNSVSLPHLKTTQWKL